MRVTAAGRAALASADHVGTAEITITRVLVGSGQGPGGAADDARTTLRNQRDAAAAGGSTTVPARIHVRGDVAPTAAYNITEVGLEARIGAGGAPFLFGYWSNAGEVYAAAVTGVTVVVITAIDVAADAPATVTISGDPAVTVLYPRAWTELTDTPAAIVAGSLYRGNAAGAALEAVTPAALLSGHLAGIAAGSYLRVRDAGGGALGLEGRTLAQVAAEITTRWHLQAAVAVKTGRPSPETLATVSGLPPRAVCTGMIAIYRPAGAGRNPWRLNWVQPSGAILAYVNPESVGEQAGISRFPVQFTLPAGVTQIRLQRTGSPPGGFSGSASAIYIYSGPTNTFLIATIA